MPECPPADQAGITRIGLIGSGRMARALARGWGKPVLCTDAGSGRAAALVAEVGGEVAASNADLAARADLVVLCHKPAQLAAVASQIDGAARAVVSILSGVTVTELRGVYRRSPVARLAVNLPVEVGAGVASFPLGQDIGEQLERDVVTLFSSLGILVRIPEDQVRAVIALAGVGPALLAVFAEAQADAAIAAGLAPDLAAMLSTQTMRGTAALLAARGHDTLSVRRSVASPGGVTARALETLEANGMRHCVIASSRTAQQLPVRYSDVQKGIVPWMPWV
jgi:pyrroline-5-carboxylate reductase